jgi:hypothetical protein
MSRSRLKGAASFRRLLRRLPEAAREEVASFLDGAGARLLGRARAETPRKTGELAAALTYKLLPKSLRLRIGLLTKRTQRDYYYGYILDQGRKAKRVMIRRGPRKGAYMNIRAIPRNRYNFVFGRGRDFRQNEVPKLRSVMDAILRRAAMGVGDD